LKKTKLVDRMEIRRSIARLPLIIETKSHKRPVFSPVALLGNANPGGGLEKRGEERC